VEVSYVVMQFGYALLGETCTSMNKCEVVGELFTGNKKPLQLRRGLMFVKRRVQDLNLCNQIKG